MCKCFWIFQQCMQLPWWPINMGNLYARQSSWNTHQQLLHIPFHANHSIHFMPSIPFHFQPLHPLHSIPHPILFHWVLAIPCHSIPFHCHFPPCDSGVPDFRTSRIIYFLDTDLPASQPRASKRPRRDARSGNNLISGQVWAAWRQSLFYSHSFILGSLHVSVFLYFLLTCELLSRRSTDPFCYTNFLSVESAWACVACALQF